MYCPNCGKENSDDAIFCSSCGNSLDINAGPARVSPQGATIMYSIPQKSTGIGIVLSFLWVGLGHLYAGQIGKGLGLMVAYIALLVISIFLLFPAIIALVLWLWAMFDTRDVINQYNEYTRRTGNPPW